MDISTLFNKTFMLTIGDIEVPVNIHAGFEHGQDIDNTFHGSSILDCARSVERRFVKAIHLYPFNPAVVLKAREAGYNIIEVRKLDRDLDDIPSLVAFSHSEGDDDGYCAKVIAEDITNTELGDELWSTVN